MSQFVDEISRRNILWRTLGVDRNDRRLLVRARDSRRDGSHVWHGLDRLLQLVGHGQIALGVDSDNQRPIEARAEAVGKPIVGNALRCRLGCGPGICSSELDTHDGCGEEQHHGQRDDQKHPGVRSDETAPACDHGLLGGGERVVGSLDERNLEAIHLVAEQRQHGRK